MLFQLLSVLLCAGLGAPAFAQVPEWNEGAVIMNPRPNPFFLPEAEFVTSQKAGRLHAQFYPVTVTGLLPPLMPLKHFVEDRSVHPLRFLIQVIFRRFMEVRSINDLFKWVGLHPFPLPTEEGVYSAPYPGEDRPQGLMGLTSFERNGTRGFTLSCAACHSANLFGKTVLGMTNRFPRANETFRRAVGLAPYYSPSAFHGLTGASSGDLKLMNETLTNLRAVGVRRPLAVGLDTSLAQVALSLGHRNEDSYATKNPFYEMHPREDLLSTQPADSKPAVWWNLKYKNRWLSDGSVVSGNPVFTNLLWNEVGRGTDLQELEKWMDENPQVIRDLTTAVFSSEAPRITDFFPPEHFKFSDLKEGQNLFNLHCARCHGTYVKAWGDPATFRPTAEILKTTEVRYPLQTEVMDVGTDPFRWKGMKSLEKLNELSLSKKMGTVIRAQVGYVPPPLVGIWARWPYFHNNSIPDLCALLTPGPDRPLKYYSGEANDRQRDFNFDCNGYPLAEKTPANWRTKEFLFDTTRPGMGRFGHDEGIIVENGEEIFSPEQKKSLIRFLQTL